MMKKIKRLLIALLVLFAALQLVPTNAKLRNPPASKPEQEIQIADPLKQALKRACYDCHSNQTRWPLYTNIFPISKMIEHEVAEGRKELNFSVWQPLSLKRKSKKSFEIIEVIELKEMPPKQYLRMHKDAIISGKELQGLRLWADRIDKEYARSQ